MGRAKIKMELIEKEKTRNSTYSKRKHGLRTKLHEFRTLWFETFPPELDKVNEIITRYQQVPKEDKEKMILTLKNFFEDQNRKSEAELVKLRKQNQELQFSLDDMISVTVDQLQPLYHNLNVKKELVEQRIKSTKAMNSSGVMDGSKKMAEFPNSIGILHSQPFGYPLPAMAYHYPNNIPTTKHDPTDHENHSTISNNGTPMFAKPMIENYGSNYGYLNMGNQYYLDSSYANQHMGSTMMSTASMYHPLGQIPPGVSFQMQQYLHHFMNTPQTHHQHQFMSSGSSS
ncbi:hypothetical protein MKW98_020912 [Papaver atlanticum]|uniref:MADS-box domain-containing protein n=1 Tax=Papaver atlanticum TaxID=357466 RepID=A0AAD4TG28_9MAGN|nr:hypothetical protein MKW98_020912 [Papaver atlanticum]